MKIAYVSDIHLEHNTLTEIIAPDADVLVLAGDIIDSINLKYMSEHNDVDMDFFKVLSEKYPHVLYVLGNHEHYYSVIDQTAALFKDRLSHFPNFHVLDNETFEIDDVKFFGGTMWTDFDDNPYLAHTASLNLYDYKAIHRDQNDKIRPTDILYEHEKYRLKMKKFLTDTDPSEKVVIITHHGCSDLSIDARYKGDELNAAFVSDMSDYLLDYECLKLWIHGHVHQVKDYELGHTRVVCNPHGYFFENDSIETCVIKIVEI